MRSITMTGLIAFALLIAPNLTAQKSKADSDPNTGRGKYLVESVARCGDCHTPRNEKGEPVEEKYLKGSILFFKPVAPMPVWAEKSPNIAGLPGWEKDAAIKFFMTGIAYNDLPARPPMPPYRLSQPDAEAVVAYLQSLAPAK